MSLSTRYTRIDLKVDIRRVFTRTLRMHLETRFTCESVPLARVLWARLWYILDQNRPPPRLPHLRRPPRPRKRRRPLAKWRPRPSPWWTRRRLSWNLPWTKRSKTRSTRSHRNWPRNWNRSLATFPPTWTRHWPRVSNNWTPSWTTCLPRLRVSWTTPPNRYDHSHGNRERRGLRDKHE